MVMNMVVMAMVWSWGTADSGSTFTEAHQNPPIKANPLIPIYRLRVRGLSMRLNTTAARWIQP